MPRRTQRLSVVLGVVFALIGAPASSALRNECDLCPRTCPMHQQRARAAHGAAPHLGCHGAPAGTSRHAHHNAHGSGPSVSRAACGNHGIVPATVLPPMILPAALGHAVVAAARSAPLPSPGRPGRQADPPDTPPPIGAA
jgi:hypothetical protein